MAFSKKEWDKQNPNYMSEWRAARKAACLCQDCGGKSRVGRLRCADCSAKRVLECRTNTRRRLGQLKNNAKERKLAVTLSDKQAIWLMFQPCAYCGKTVDPSVTLGGIDRAKNEYGYTPLNSVPCCADHNYLKGRFGVKEFIALCLQVAAKHKDYQAFNLLWEQNREQLKAIVEEPVGNL